MATGGVLRLDYLVVLGGLGLFVLFPALSIVISTEYWSARLAWLGIELESDWDRWIGRRVGGVRLVESD